MIFASAFSTQLAAAVMFPFTMADTELMIALTSSMICDAWLMKNITMS